VTSFRASARILVAAAVAGLYACSGSSAGSGPTASLTLLPSATSVRNDGTPVSILARAVNAAGTPGSGTVTFVAPFGTLTDSGGAPANTVTLATDGTGTINYSCNVAVDSRCVAGNVFVSGSWSSAGKTLTLTVSNVAPGGGTPPPPPGGGGTPPPPVGTPPGPPTNIAVTASNPPVLGLKGSGIQERGTIAYLVTDSLGVPAPGITVNFALQAPTLGITLLKTSAVSDLNGVVTEGYTSGAEVGVTAITATIPTTGAFVLQPVAVRGAKPSANGFYFRCANASLPVYTTVMEYEKTACTVRLTDRFGNRVGIPTVVNFATEAGAIAASVTTKGFDPKTPDNPTEGTATVTFTTDMGNGSSPADVAPLAVTAGQFPWDLANPEPSTTDGQLTLNPRDQLVTIIAMTRGEEAFEDANHNGLLDPGEVFIDQGDPFVDANDNNAYDATLSGGLAEVRFCGLNADCSTYHGPNGVWDADTVIWKPTWVVFTGPGSARTAPAGVAEPASDFTGAAAPACADYKDAFVANHSSTVTAPIFVSDRWLNTPSAGFSTSIGNPSSSALTTTGLSLPGTPLETFGSMDFDWVRVSALVNTKACDIANGAACVERLAFHFFSAGGGGILVVQNTTAKPTAPASTTGTGCAPGPDQFGSKSFQVPVTVTNANGVSSTRAFKGLFAPGTTG